MNDDSIKQWLGFCATIVSGVAVLISFAYSNFSTIEDADKITKRLDDADNSIVHRLERIEDKVDRLLQRR